MNFGLQRNLPTHPRFRGKGVTSNGGRGSGRVAGSYNTYSASAACIIHVRSAAVLPPASSSSFIPPPPPLQTIPILFSYGRRRFCILLPPPDQCRLLVPVCIVGREIQTYAFDSGLRVLCANLGNVGCFSGGRLSVVAPPSSSANPIQIS